MCYYFFKSKFTDICVLGGGGDMRKPNHPLPVGGQQFEEDEEEDDDSEETDDDDDDENGEQIEGA